MRPRSLYPAVHFPSFLRPSVKRQRHVNQTGGTHSISSNTIIGSHSNAVGTYTLSSGSLSTAFTEMGRWHGQIHQSGGIHRVYGLTIGSNSSGGVLHTQRQFQLAASRLVKSRGQCNWRQIPRLAGGNFTQTGGNHQVSAAFHGSKPWIDRFLLAEWRNFTHVRKRIHRSCRDRKFHQTSGTNSTFELEVGFKSRQYRKWNFNHRRWPQVRTN